MYTFKVEGSPLSQNRLHKPTSRGTIIRTKAYRQFLHDVGWIAKKERTEGRIPFFSEGEVDLTIRYNHRNPKHYLDTPNTVNAISNALQGVLIENDKQFRDVKLIRRHVKAKTHFIVELSQVEE